MHTFGVLGIMHSESRGRTKCAYVYLRSRACSVDCINYAISIHLHFADASRPRQTSAESPGQTNPQHGQPTRKSKQLSASLCLWFRSKHTQTKKLGNNMFGKHVRRRLMNCRHYCNALRWQYKRMHPDSCIIMCAHSSSSHSSVEK